MLAINKKDNFAICPKLIKETEHHTFKLSNDKDHIAIMPAPLAELFNLSFGTELEAAQWLVLIHHHHINGNRWKLEEPLRIATILWEGLKDIPVNEDEEIEEYFLYFKEGTSKYDILHWLEYSFDIKLSTLEAA